MDENIRKLKELVDGSDNIVFFGAIQKNHSFSIAAKHRELS